MNVVFQSEQLDIVVSLQQCSLQFYEGLLEFLRLVRIEIFIFLLEISAQLPDVRLQLLAASVEVLF